MNAMISADERNCGDVCEPGGTAFSGAYFFCGLLMIYLKARSESTPFVETHPRRSLNFQITFSLLVVVVIVTLLGTWGATVGAFLSAGTHSQNVGAPLAFITVACISVVVLLFALVANFVCCILGEIAASGDRLFHYHAIPFVR